MSPYEGVASDNSTYYSVMVYPADGVVQKFIGKHHQAQSNNNAPCLHAVTSLGGRLGELDDSVIEGYYTQYMVAGLFSTQFKYSQFGAD